MITPQTALSAEEKQNMLALLQQRFENHMHRHAQLQRTNIQSKLEAHPKVLRSLYQMEETWWEPDVIGYDSKAGTYIFCDCSPQSPTERRSLCYDREALESRKEHKPLSNALDMAIAMGIELLTEEQYRALQKLEAFDTKTSSRVTTPAHIRKLGGALFCDRRYDTIFTYHNGAESYYAARGFRGILKV